MTHIFNLARKPRILHRRPLKFGELPIIYLIPPPPHPTPQRPPTQRRTPIPIPPPRQHQRPQCPLHKRQNHLIANRDPRNPPPGIRVLETSEVALLEAEVGEGREVAAADDGADHAAGVDDVGGDAVCVGDGGFRDWSLFL